MTNNSDSRRTTITTHSGNYFSRFSLPRPLRRWASLKLTDAQVYRDFRPTLVYPRIRFASASQAEAVDTALCHWWNAAFSLIFLTLFSCLRPAGPHAAAPRVLCRALLTSRSCLLQMEAPTTSSSTRVRSRDCLLSTTSAILAHHEDYPPLDLAAEGRLYIRRTTALCGLLRLRGALSGGGDDCCVHFFAFSPR